MAETAALLADEVFPDDPLRQWVISFPFPLRYLLPVLPENTYRLIFFNFFRCDVNLIFSLIVAADEDPES
jgi:hypothetical protein